MWRLMRGCVLSVMSILLRRMGYPDSNECRSPHLLFCRFSGENSNSGISLWVSYTNTHTHTLLCLLYWRLPSLTELGWLQWVRQPCILLALSSLALWHGHKVVATGYYFHSTWPWNPSDPFCCIYYITQYLDTSNRTTHGSRRRNAEL